MNYMIFSFSRTGAISRITAARRLYTYCSLKSHHDMIMHIVVVRGGKSWRYAPTAAPYSPAIAHTSSTNTAHKRMTLSTASLAHTAL